jgi:diguanylate cyclase (GGDEF)-like protein
MISLLFTISLAKRHIIQNRKNTYYIVAAYMTIALLILEILANLIIIPCDADYIVLHKLINSLGFTLSPAVPYVFLKFIGTTDDRYGSRTLWIAPLAINTILSLSSYWTGLIFSIDALNHYIRGSVFFIPTTVSMLYYGIVIYEILKNRARVARPDTLILFLIFLLPVGCTIIQIAFPHLLLIWPSVALSLLLYYVYSLELQYDYDIQSQIKNRTAFDKKMAQCASNTDVTIFVFDLNNLKKINDKFGHSEGDKLIKSAATILNTCFSSVGDAFRIGGDEFSVICPDLNDDAADALLIALKHLIDLHNQNATHLLELAQGYAHYDVHSSETIYATLSRADDAMYAHKAYYKATFERRASDH